MRLCWPLLLMLASLPALSAAPADKAPDGPVDLDHWTSLGKAAIPGEELRARLQADSVATVGAVPGHLGDVVLFGDLHVHTTYSVDAFLRALPLVIGTDGATPPIDACNYARYIAQLDFFALTDHAEEATPEHWKKALEAMRLCAAVSDRHVPDIVPFMGFEWTQIGQSAQTHWGHHNVIFKSLEPGQVASRPIRVPSTTGEEVNALPAELHDKEPQADQSFYAAFNQFARSLAGIARCPPGSPRDRDDCQEVAASPGELEATLKRWGYPHLIIPHGSAWGLDEPSDSTWSKELHRDQYDPSVTRLIEVYSGHGSSEQYVPEYEFSTAADGSRTCLPPSRTYLPECWQAGEIIRKRCLGTGNSDKECEKRAVDARANYLKMPSVAGWLVVPNSTPEEWLDAGQARNTFMPAFRLVPQRTVQYGLAMTNFDDPAHPLRFRWGFVSSTDTHSARPGHGFKQLDRARNVDLWFGFRSVEKLRKYRNLEVPAGTPLDRSLTPDRVDLSALGATPDEMERLGSFLSLGGLVAVHAKERSREAIWKGLQSRNVYATTGVRILLWFDLLNAAAAGKNSSQLLHMGEEGSMAGSPRFKVVAVGSPWQRPGCPQFIKDALDAARLSHLSGNECFYPTGRRRAISRIEVVRIRPQQHPGEDIASLIEDPWRTISCAPHATRCETEFTDPGFTRDSVYYVRALEEPTPTVNGKNLRTRFDENGNGLSVTPCYMDTRTDPKDDCLEKVEQRAWSSPIFLTHSDGPVRQ